MIQQPFALSESFIPATVPRDGAAPAKAWWFVCKGENLLVSMDDKRSIGSLPQAVSLDELGIVPVRTQFLGYLKGVPCLGVGVKEEAQYPERFAFENLRSLHGLLSDDLFAIAARAVQIIEWDRTHQYCGHCATVMIQFPSERAKRCPNCQLRQYPRLSPAVIMLISKGEKLLLARAPRFRNGMYSVLAGFVEPGESLEETVVREVREEVGIEIKNICYFGSQPWPFPDSLMVGFTAEYASGTITPDPAEIEAADWFGKTELPPVPGKLSIARKLIDTFVAS